MGLEALELLVLAKEFYFLRHAPCVTLSRERLIDPYRGAVLGSPLSLGGSGHTFWCLGLG
jgi:hypothetical protein